VRHVLDSELWRFARTRPSMIFGFVVIAINLVLALIGPLIAPFPTQA
jgi:N-terminal TM domain of oligopeptide transport permease C